MHDIIARAGDRIDAIRINSIERVTHDGAVWMRKKRLPASRVLIPVANAFFRMAGNPVKILSGVEWHRWEEECFRRLHGHDGFFTRAESGASFSREMPGTDLSTHLKNESLEAPMLAAAGAELRRAHALECPAFGSAWSHGDPHLGNFIFDPWQNRARLMDFEVRHHVWLGTTERHADDLLVFLQDLIGRIPKERWLPFAMAFLRAYDREEIIATLKPRLSLPGGLTRIWWAVRTTYMPSGELKRRLAELREAL